MKENHWREYKDYRPGLPANPWRISYALTQYTLASYPPDVTKGQTEKLTAIPSPADTFAGADVSHELNHVAIIHLGQARTAPGTSAGGMATAIPTGPPTSSSSTGTSARTPAARPTASS
jgi:hypothetical protein